MPIEGVAALTQQLRDLGQAVTGKTLRAAVRAGGNVVKKAAQARVPVGSELHKTYKDRLVAPGFAQRSVRVVVKASKDGSQAAALIGTRREAFYAVNFLELGTSKMPARPWLRPAMESTQEEQQAAIAKIIKRAVERAARAKSGAAR